MSTPHPFVYLALALLFGVGLWPRPAMAEPLVTGQVLHMTLRSNPDQQYLLYLPTTGPKDAPIFVTVHGISRNVEEHATRFAPYAERYRVVLVAPYFPKKNFPDYQRLGRVGQGDRADQVLQKIVTEVGELTGARSDKLYLFGYSGGAQFVHRYMLAFPERVAKLVVGAAGWYTFPDPHLSYPKGIKPSPQLPGDAFVADEFLQVPACVVVGKQDVNREANLDQAPGIDRHQGYTRVERGRNWIAAMQKAAREKGYATPYVFRTVPRTAHSFTQSMRRGKMGDMVFECLFGDVLTVTK